MKSRDKKALLADALRDTSLRENLITEATRNYVALSKNKHTQEAYHFAISEFRHDFGGELPCTDEALAGYLSVFSVIHSPATLALRKSMISKWHKHHKEPDPADSQLVRDVLKGIRKKMGSQQKQAKALNVDQLELLVNYFDERLLHAATLKHEKKRQAVQLSARRDKAFVLLGYWFGLRSESLLMLTAQHVSIERTVQGKTLTLFQLRSKTDQEARGRTRTMRETGFLCPVTALEQWLEHSNIENTQGPVFSKISQWGAIAEDAIHPKSVNRMMREYFAGAGLDAQLYSSHSMRRGLANFLKAQKQTDKEIMDWIGWKDYRSALRYQDGQDALSNEALSRYIHQRFAGLRNDQFLIT